MRAKGEGTVQRVGKKFRGVLTTDGVRVFGPLTSDKSKALELARLKAEKESLVRHSFSTYLRSWIEKRNLAHSTRSLYRTILETRISDDPLGRTDIHSITEADLRAFRDRQSGSGATINNVLGLVHACLKSAGNHSAIPRPPKRQNPIPLLTPAEVSKVLAYQGEARSLIHLCLLCGLRRSEACGLRHEDREGSGIVIRRAIVPVDGNLVVKGTKTGKERWVPLPPSLEFIGSGEGFVLGDPLDPVKASRMWDSVRIELGIQGGLHKLRGTYGMTLLEGRVDIRTAAEMMGHDVAMLVKQYAMSRKDLKEAAMKVLIARMSSK